MAAAEDTSIAGTLPESNKQSKPAWLAPVVVVGVVIGLVIAGRKKEEAVANPLVDIAVLTVGVFAFAAAFRWMGAQLGSPGLATFFGGK